MKLTKEQFDTLKDFDLEMFKKGVKIISTEYPSDTEEYIAEDDMIIVTRSINGLCYLYKHNLNTWARVVKMLPLFFVEDKPVYPGDVLYDAESGTEVKMYNATSDKQGTYLTWNKPKVKKEGWVNLYRCVASSTGVELGQLQLHPTEDIALKTASGVVSYIKTIRIEWEE